jgi:hypothetical protein
MVMVTECMSIHHDDDQKKSSSKLCDEFTLLNQLPSASSLN